MLNTKEDILKNVEESNSCWSPLTSRVGKEILWKSVGTINCLITSILQNIFFYVQHKKETHTGLEWHEGEEIMTIFILGWTIPLRQFLVKNEIAIQQNYWHLLKKKIKNARELELVWFMNESVICTGLCTGSVMHWKVWCSCTWHAGEKNKLESFPVLQGRKS